MTDPITEMASTMVSEAMKEKAQTLGITKFVASMKPQARRELWEILDQWIRKDD